MDIDASSYKARKLMQTRVAPATVPAGLEAQEAELGHVQLVHRAAVRALCLALEPGFSLGALDQARQKLAQMAAAQGLRVLEQPLFTLDADPLGDPPERWSWRLLLPIRGKAEADDEVTVARTHGGTFVQVTPPGGIGELGQVYAHVLGSYLPRYKHALSRPCIYHRLLGAAEAADQGGLAVAVWFPVILSIQRVETAAAQSELSLG